MEHRSRRVLIVDDDPDVREILTLALEGEQYSVREAANGHEALSVLARWRADLIVLDLMMPEMDGRSFLTEQHRIRDYADIPVLIVSALHDLPRQTSGLDALAVYEKPVLLDDFLTAVRGLMERAPQ
jgi:CheY-like chemotaxis protein